MRIHIEDFKLNNLKLRIVDPLVLYAKVLTIRAIIKPEICVF